MLRHIFCTVIHSTQKPIIFFPTKRHCLNAFWTWTFISQLAELQKIKIAISKSIANQHHRGNEMSMVGERQTIDSYILKRIKFLAKALSDALRRSFITLCLHHSLQYNFPSLQSVKEGGTGNGREQHDE